MHPNQDPATSGTVQTDEQVLAALGGVKDLIDKLPLVGHAAWLLSHIPNRRTLFLSDIEWAILPPMVLNQFKLYEQGSVPLGYVSWAYVSEEVEKRLLQGDMKLRVNEWKCGDRLWLIDLAAPFGSREEIIKDLNTKTFAGKQVWTLGMTPAGVPGRVELA